MAGQQQDPWQPYSQPPADGQDTRAFSQPGAAPVPPEVAQGAPQGAPHGAPHGQDQAWARPAPGYPGPSYGFQDPRLGQAPPDYAYPGPQGMGQQWQATPGMHGGLAARSRGDAQGFLSALFDFGFTAVATHKIVKVLYVLFTIWTVFWALIFIRLGFKYGGAAGGIFMVVLVDPIFILLTLGVSRVILEFFVVTHRIHDEVKAIRDRTGEGE